ncbi:MAG: threonine ammonia-lyase [Bdellovibrionota bacterium]
MKVELDDFIKARQLLAPIIQQTPIERSRSGSERFGAPVIFKLENQQKTGSFKIRGAYNKISKLTAAEKAKGVIASSAGNHAQGVALSAQLAGVKATIVMPETASLSKVAATKAYGAEVILHGNIYDEAFEKAQQLKQERGLVFVHPYEDVDIIAGQGTIGLEIFEQIPDLETVVVPIGGGGVMSGIAKVIKTKNPKCRVIGVQSVQVPGMFELFKKVSLPKILGRTTTIADGIAVKKTSPLMFEHFISKYVDDIVTVSDDEIAESIVFLLERSKTLSEGSGAAAWAAGLSGKIKATGPTCFLVSGGNIDLNILSKVIQSGQIRRGGLAHISVVVPDLPGSLSRLAAMIANEKANILEVHHDRVSQNLFLRETRIDFVLETANHEHVERIKAALVNGGGRIV